MLKILVLSHNCFSDKTANGRTLTSFFKKWDSSNVAQFYINIEIPTTTVCNTFYRITDKDIISALAYKKKAGEKLRNNSTPEKAITSKEGERSSSIFNKLKKTFPSALIIARNLLWASKKWDNANFNNWINSFNPDIILLHPGDYSFIYKIARLIATRKKIPLVIFNSEDYYLKDKFSLSPFFHLQRFYFKKEFNKTFNAADLIIYSNDLLERNLHKYYKNKSAVLLTSSEIIPSNKKSANQPLRLIYAGNIGHERWNSLVKIGRVAKSIDNKLVIEVYSSFLPKEAAHHFKSENGIDYKGSVNYEKLTEIISDCDIVIHAEGFSNFTKWDIRHGFSTKIADLLSSEKCFLMYGPKGIACVDYLINNNAAWVASTEKELQEVMSKIINNEIDRKKYIENAKTLVKKRHNIDKNCKKFEDLMQAVYLNQQSKK